MSEIIASPTFGSATLPFPDAATISPIWISAENLTLGGKTRRDVMARKYQYTMSWNYMSVNDYNALETVINALSSATFTYAKWPQSTSGVSCLGKLADRKLVYGVGDTSFYSNVTLTLIEENSRI
jgi:hypothetical protein